MTVPLTDRMESTDPKEEEPNLLQRLRKSIFPVQQADTPPVRMLKHSAFYLFAVMVVLISAAIVIAISFVL
jgi:hypothetical protein